MITYNIAFAGKPTSRFLDQLRSLSANDGVTIRAAVVVDGPECRNLAFMLDAPNEGYVNSLTMVLMPAKWSTATPELPDGTLLGPGMFEDRSSQ